MANIINILTIQDFYYKIYLLIEKGVVEFMKSSFEKVSFISLVQMFPDNNSARLFIEKLRWNGNVVCPVCGSDHVTGRKGTREGYYWCNDCHKEFSVRTESIMECSRIPLNKWILAIYLFVTCRNGISSRELAEDIGITQKSAWGLLHKIRMAAGNGDKLLKGIIEADETYIGGKEKFKHSSKKSHAGRGAAGKTAVFGMIARDGHVVAKVVDNTKSDTLFNLFDKHVSADSIVYTDEFTAYDKLNELGYEHDKVNHSVGKYVDGDVHTNTIENFWSNLKARIKGTYRSVSVKHLQKYVDEVAFAFNEGNAENAVMNRIEALVMKLFGIYTRYKVMIGTHFFEKDLIAANDKLVRERYRMAA